MNNSLRWIKVEIQNKGQSFLFSPPFLFSFRSPFSCKRRRSSKIKCDLVQESPQWLALYPSHTESSLLAFESIR